MFRFEPCNNFASNASFDWLAAQIPSVEFKQVERATDGACECAVAADQLKYGKPVLVANNCLAIDQARAGPGTAGLPAAPPATAKAYHFHAAMLRFFANASRQPRRCHTGAELLTP